MRSNEDNSYYEIAIAGHDQLYYNLKHEMVYISISTYRKRG